VREPSGIVRSSAGAKIKSCSWVHRKGREREKKKEDLLAESARTVCFTLINHKHSSVDVALERG
jgi:hypothetical protein